MEKAIYVITGVMASGKSSVAEAFARSLEKCVHLRGDVFRKMIVTGRDEMSERPSKEALKQLKMRHSITAKVAIEYYNNGFTVVVQDNFLGQNLLYFLKLLKPCPTYIIVLNPSITAIQQRNRNRIKNAYVGFTVESLYKIFLEETSKIGLWLDTSNMTIEETVTEIRKRTTNKEQYR